MQVLVPVASTYQPISSIVVAYPLFFPTRQLKLYTDDEDGRLQRFFCSFAF